MTGVSETVVVPTASNPENKVTLAAPDSPGGCDGGGRHPRVELNHTYECAHCGGDDDYGQPFCPVCEYCCGC